MPLRVTARRSAADSVDVPLLVLALRKNPSLPADLAALDASLGGTLSRTLGRRDFRGGRDEVLHLSGSAGAATPQRVLLIGLGEPTDAAGALRRAAGLAARQAKKLGASALAWYDGGRTADTVEAVTVGLLMGAWEYIDLKTPPPADDRRAELESAIILCDDARAAQAVERGTAIGEGMALARRLAMMPGNRVYAVVPRRHGPRNCGASQNAGHGTRPGRDGKGKDGLVPVRGAGHAAGSQAHRTRVHARTRGRQTHRARRQGAVLRLGGISIKPAQGMEAMKFDMCGAAGVLGALDAIGRLGLPVNVVGLVGSTTNMPSGTAVNPGDVVRSHLGKTIEVINTDAEGRLVLADVLSYARRFEPSAVVDAATLTGACVVALGHTASGVFGDDDALVADVLAAGARAGEPGWRLPLFDEYKDLIKSDVADIKNTGGRPAGASTAAMFLKEFAEDLAWVHMDIAGTAYSETDLGYIPKGPTGVPVGTFVELVRGRAR